MNKIALLNSMFLLLSLIIGGKSFSEPPNLTIVKQQAIQYHDNGQYQRELRQVNQQALDFIKNQIKTHPQKNYALVLDIDETCLSNYKNLLARDFINDFNVIHQDIAKGDATPIASTLKLYNFAKKHQISIFLISGRFENERQITIRNLHKAGFKGWKKLYLQPDTTAKNKVASIEQFKIAKRRSIEKQGYKILASIGDQPVDLSGGYAMKTFKLPNPYYYIPAKIHQAA